MALIEKLDMSSAAFLGVCHISEAVVKNLVEQQHRASKVIEEYDKSLTGSLEACLVLFPIATHH